MKRIITLYFIALLSFSHVIKTAENYQSLSHPTQPAQEQLSHSIRRKKLGVACLALTCASGLIAGGMAAMNAVHNSMYPPYVPTPEPRPTPSPYWFHGTELDIHNCNNCTRIRSCWTCLQPHEAYNAIKQTIQDICNNTSKDIKIIEVHAGYSEPIPPCIPLNTTLDEITTECRTRSGYSTQRFATPHERFKKHKKKNR